MNEASRKIKTGDATAQRLIDQSQIARDLLAHMDDEDFRHDIAEGETSLFEAIDIAMNEIAEKQAIVEGSKAIEDKFAKRRSSATARIEKVRGLIEQAMTIAEIKTVKRPIATLSLSQSAGGVIVTDEALLPSRFFVTQPPKLDKKALNEAVKNGEQIEGAIITNGNQSLKIRIL